ncbi:aconitase X catalytic domain-containing protein [soil metagenome]
MRIVLGLARAMGADRLLDVRSAHVDGCLYQGQVSLDFAERLVDGGARVAIPTTLNVGALDLLHPERYRGDHEAGERGRRLMEAYVSLGCRPTWTCAPYQLPARPSFGEHVAWAESNAIVFANSVLGARTERYGDFIDICAAITGRAPDAGLHRAEKRRGEIVFRMSGVPERLLREDVLFPVLGHLVGKRAGTMVPVLEGLPPATTEDQLKALGAAAASSGSVALFHAVGVTPEAPSLYAALGGRRPGHEVEVTTRDLVRARDSLSTGTSSRLRAVSIGTPHASLAEFEKLIHLLGESRVRADVEFFVSTGRHILRQIEDRGWLLALEEAGVRVVTDTCTYVTPMIPPGTGVVMTNSAKWAHYAPANIGAEVLFASTAECVRSAVLGTIWRDPELWPGE